MPVAVLLPRLVGTFKLSPSGLEAQIAAVVETPSRLQQPAGATAREVELLAQAEASELNTRHTLDKPTKREAASSGIDSEYWYQWTPLIASSDDHAEVQHAVAAFDAGDSPSAQEATRWLRDEALRAYPSTLTYIAVAHGRVEGYFAIAGSQIALRARGEATASQFAPASIVPRHAVHREAASFFRKLILYATSVALEVAGRQGTIALVIAAADDQSAKALKEFGFRQSLSAESTTSQMWIPLHAANS
jgi:hypothetical protein